MNISIAGRRKIQASLLCWCSTGVHRSGSNHTYLRYFDLQIEEGRGRDGGFLLLACGKIVVNAPQPLSGSA
jgi:hypothetical protein